MAPPLSGNGFQAEHLVSPVLVVEGSTAECFGLWNYSSQDALRRPRAVSSTCFLSRLMGIVVLERLPRALLVQMGRGKVLNNLDFRMRSQGSLQVFSPY